MLAWSSVLVMNRSEEIELFRRSREVTIFRASNSNNKEDNKEDLVLSVLKAPVKTACILTSASEDDENEDLQKRIQKNVIQSLCMYMCLRVSVYYIRLVVSDNSDKINV